MDLIKFKKSVRDRLIKGDLEEALTLSVNSIKEDSEWYKSIIIQIGQFKETKKLVFLGQLGKSDEKYHNTTGRITSTLLEIVGNLNDEDLMSTESKGNKIEEELEKLTKENPDESLSLTDVVSLIEKGKDEAIRYFKIFTGFISLDTNLKGLDRESLTLVCSYEIDLAKLFALNMILKCGREFRYSYFYLNLQDSSIAVTKKLIALEVGDINLMHTDYILLNSQEKKEFTTAAVTIQDIDLFFEEKTRKIDGIKRAILAKNLRRRLDLVVIDNLSFIQSEKSLNEVLHELKVIAKIQKTPILVLHQVDQTNIDTVVLGEFYSGLRNNRYIDNLMMLESPSYTEQQDYINRLVTNNETQEHEFTVRVNIEKSQNGTVDIQRLRIESTTGKISDYEKTENLSGDLDDDSIPF